MKKSIFLILCGLFLTNSIHLENQKPIGDFFHGKTAKYKVEFKVLFKNYDVKAEVEFLKVGKTEYLTKFTLDKNYVKYIVKTAGIIYNNKLYPVYVEEKVKITVFDYTTKYKYHYDENHNVIKVHIEESGDTGFPTKMDFTNLSKKNHITDLLSGILQLVYWSHYNQSLEALDIVRNNYILQDLKLRTYEKDGVKYAKLKDKEQEKKFDLRNLSARVGKDGWPEKITVDKHWILKNLKIALIPLQ